MCVISTNVTHFIIYFQESATSMQIIKEWIGKKSHGKTTRRKEVRKKRKWDQYMPVHLMKIENSNSFVVLCCALTNFCLFFFSSFQTLLQFRLLCSFNAFWMCVQIFPLSSLLFHVFILLGAHRIFFLFGLYLNVLAICAFETGKNTKIRLKLWYEFRLCITMRRTLSMKWGAKDMVCKS